MGNCTACTNSSSGRRTIKILDRFNEQPQDTLSFEHQKLPTLQFHALLRKVRIKNCPYKKLNVKFIISSIDELDLSQKAPDINNKFKWNIQEKFEFMCTEYELRKKFLVIQVLTEGSLISTLKINLYLISVGPYHLDFAFPIEMSKENKIQGQQPRIAFDLKIAQLPKEVEIIENQEKQFVNDKFAYSLKAIVGSNPIITPISHPQKPSEDKFQVKWSKKDEENLAIIRGKFPFYQFHHASLKFLFWRVEVPQQKKEPEILIAECYISFLKLFGFDSVIKQKEGNAFEQKNISLQQKLWFNGQQCGKMKLKVNITIAKSIKQMLVCVRTEQGICKASPVFNFPQKIMKSNCPQISELETLTKKISHQQNQITKIRIKKSNGHLEIIAHSREIQKLYEMQAQILKKSSKQTIMIFSYVNENQLIKGQQIILEIGRSISQAIHQQFMISQDTKWKVLSLILQRGQFNLNYIGFDRNQQINKSSSLLEKKKNIAFQFQNFLYEILKHTLFILGEDSLTQEKKFAQEYCAIAYFRIPEFRKTLLKLIQRQDDPEIKEWRGTDFSLSDDSSHFRTFLPGQNTFQILFDWQNYFYKHLQGAPQYEKNMNKLRSILEARDWEKRINKRQGVFFSFIRQWVKYVSKVSVRIVNTNWKYFPGYIQILRCFLAQMKIRKIIQYPSTIKIACNSLINNENLLNIFITILFNKTNIYGNSDILKVLDLCGNLFKTLQNLNKKIPTSFNYPFFFSGIKMIIENDYAFTIGKALSILYDHFQLFHEEFRIQISNYILGKIFFKLFLHWYKNVRTMLHHIMVVRIHIFIINMLKDPNISQAMRESVRALSKRYQSLLVALENLKKVKSKQYIPSTEIQLHKKLKNKLRKMKKDRRDQQRGRENGNLNEIEAGKMKIKFPVNTSTIQSRPQLQEENQRIMQELCRPQIRKYDSQMLTQQIKVAFEQNPIMDKDEVIRKKSSGYGLTRESAQISFGQNQGLEGEYREKNPRKRSFNIPIIDQTQLPLLSQQQIKFIVPAMFEFTGTNSTYEKNLIQKRGAPVLKMELMVDSSQLRPQTITNCQQW